MNNVAIILTKNEALHLERCLRNVTPVFSKIYVIDSFSSDNTKEIANKFSVEFLQNKFLNHSQQFNWALDQIDKNTNWILRIDADEYLSKSLIKEISDKLENLDSSIMGIFIPRQIIFQDQLIKYGGVNKTKILRLFKYGFGRCDDRWMDEHIVVNGETLDFLNPIIDNNLKSISWWISKHNYYSNKQAYELLKFEFNQKESKPNFHYKSFKNRRRYYKSTPIIRAFVYFLYRYFICLGFLDGINGFYFHFLQGLWYRLIVDIKFLEVKKQIKNKNISFKQAINDYLLIDLDD